MRAAFALWKNHKSMKEPRIDEMILHEDENLIVLAKPAGLASTAERNEGRVNLLALLRARNPGARLCHRIDRETSGVMIAAKTFSAYRVLAELFRRRQVSKVYHAVVWGRTAFDEHAIALPLRTVAGTFRPAGQAKGEPVSTFRAVVDASRRGRPSRTIVTTLSASRRFSLLECRPLTGRMHQIRIHLSREGFPILCDPLYRGAPPFLSEIKRGYRRSGEDEERPLIRRVALHARSIGFELFGEERLFEAPYPKDFAALLKALSKYDGLVTPPVS